MNIKNMSTEQAAERLVTLLNERSNIAPLIDELGDVKAQIAKLEKRETELKKELKALGIGTHVGTRYVMTLSEQERDVLDMKAVKEKLSSQFIVAHTSVTKYPMFRFLKRNENSSEAA
jgi:hypothetical protein